MNEFRQRLSQKERLPRARRTIVWIFVLCAIPCVSFPAAVFGLIWYAVNRESVRALPSLYSGLCKIALGVGIGQSVLLAIMAALFSVFHAG